MEKEEQIKVAITAGIVAVILLILILFLALSGGDKKADDKKLSDNIAEYASSGQSQNPQNEADASASGTSEENTDSSAIASTGKQEAASAGKSSVAYSEYLTTAKGDVSGNGFYSTTGPLLKDVYKNVTYDRQAQLQEMLTYWQDGNAEAVRDLAHLERFEAMSYSLKGSNDFYYFGDVDGSGLPNGKGLAVYADSQYYYGDWTGGVRNGEGAWFSFYPKYSTYVVTEHMYSGTWKDDLPEGEGQEHFDYNPDYMNLQDVYLQNAIGSFSKGLYNGDMYIINVDKNGTTDEWLGKCTLGVFERIDGVSDDKKGNMPVLKMRQAEKTVFYMDNIQGRSWPFDPVPSAPMFFAKLLESRKDTSQ